MRFNFGFFLAEAFKNIRLNLLMSITAVTTTFICILVFGRRPARQRPHSKGS